MFGSCGRMRVGSLNITRRGQRVYGGGGVRTGIMAEEAIDRASLLAGHVLRSPLLEAAGFRHAFFTRNGGVSAAPFDTLNFAVSTGDDAAAVDENRARAIAALGTRGGALFYLSQVHGT